MAKKMTRAQVTALIEQTLQKQAATGQGVSCRLVESYLTIRKWGRKGKARPGAPVQPSPPLDEAELVDLIRTARQQDQIDAVPPQAASSPSQPSSPPPSQPAPVPSPAEKARLDAQARWAVWCDASPQPPQPPVPATMPPDGRPLAPAAPPSTITAAVLRAIEDIAREEMPPQPLVPPNAAPAAIAPSPTPQATQPAPLPRTSLEPAPCSVYGISHLPNEPNDERPAGYSDSYF